MFCVDPHVWRVLEVEHYRTGECIVFHQTGPSESLLSFSLTHNVQMLECEDLIRMWSCFASPPDEVNFMEKHELALELASRLSDGNVDYIEKVKEVGSASRGITNLQNGRRPTCARSL